MHSPERLLEVANALNNRPRKTLGWSTPAEAVQRPLSDPEAPTVATTAKISHAFAGQHMELIHTNLSEEQENSLREVFGEG